ncbi:protein kinase [Nocardia sp. NPDC051750]|uniref:protein kinase domain-containing protein n=1 Tax=Nocardia sp. NPDC051750 TaxID=3364325 RepID=UPI003791B334
MDSDECRTERDLGVVAELGAAGLEDAEEVGRGGFGVVFRCKQPTLDRTVAVKVLTCDLDDVRERFFREQRAMGRLTGHPNIVGVLEVGETATGRPYLVMPYYPQGSLNELIRGGAPLSLRDVLRLGVKIAGALETVHHVGILHRDIKPGNVLLSDYAEPALTDFGIAHLAGGFRTAAGAVTGSPAFTAPEVLSGGEPSEASDVYGLGATLFCALTGHAAFERQVGEQVVAQFLRIATQPVPDLRDKGIPEDVSAVVESAMSREEKRRPMAAVFGEQLQRLQAAHGFPMDEMALRAELSDESGRREMGAPARRASSPPSGAVQRGRVGNLPRELTSFVNRRSEVSDARNRLAESCLVTLTGPGGVGKSRLALRIAHKLQKNFVGGIWLVELGELHDPALLVDVTVSALGLRETNRPVLDALVDFLSARRCLLIFDTCEQVIEAVAELMETLLQACPQLRILATSREAIGIGGESVLAVPPLRFPDLKAGPTLRQVGGYDAVMLFAERAAATVPGFQLSEENRESVAGICARLDGLPLAIELAAARLRTMSPEQILERLTDRFATLTRGSRSAPTRQQTLGWCIGWSYDLCTPTEQRLWGRLSVFARSFELDAAQAVCGAGMSEPEFIDTLSALVDKSIISREEIGDSVRFRMLETVQEYGIHKVRSDGEYPDLRRGHRDWYERLALEVEADWVSSRQVEWAARVTRELSNLRNALEFSRSEGDAAGLRTAACLHNFWAATGRFSEGRRWCERILSTISSATPVETAKALCAAGAFAATLGDFTAARADVAELSALAADTVGTAIDGWFGYADGFTALTSGDLSRALTRLTDALDAFTAQGDTAFRLRVKASIGWNYVLLGDMDHAITCLDEALAEAQSLGDIYFQSLALRPLALAVWRKGEPERARQLLTEALRTARQIVDPLLAAIGLEILAWIACEQQELTRAVVLLGGADGLARSVGGSSMVYRQMLSSRRECERRSLEAVGRREYDRAYEQGLSMGFHAALGYALGEQQGAGAPASAILTKRENEVVELVAEGLTNKAIAARLVISQRTAQGHVEHILTKLGYTSRAQIAAWAVEHSSEGPGVKPQQTK